MVERLLDSQLNLDQESEDRPADEPFSRKKEPVPLFSRAPDGLRGFYSIPSKESRMSQTQPGSTEEVGDRNPWGRSCMGSQRGRESSEGGGANFRRRVSLGVSGALSRGLRGAPTIEAGVHFRAHRRPLQANSVGPSLSRGGNERGGGGELLARRTGTREGPRCGAGGPHRALGRRER